MSENPSFLEQYWALPEPIVAERDGHRCANCASIKFASFRAASALDETYRPSNLVMGDFRTLQASAFTGCWTCRLVFRAIVQTATTLHHTSQFYEIARVGLRLNLDDELSVRCWTSDGSVYPLLGHDALEIPLQDNDIARRDSEDSDRDYEWDELPTLKMIKPCGESAFMLLRL